MTKTGQFHARVEEIQERFEELQAYGEHRLWRNFGRHAKEALTDGREYVLVCRMRKWEPCTLYSDEQGRTHPGKSRQLDWYLLLVNYEDAEVGEWVERINVLDSVRTAHVDGKVFERREVGWERVE